MAVEASETMEMARAQHYLVIRTTEARRRIVAWDARGGIFKPTSSTCSENPGRGGCRNDGDGASAVLFGDPDNFFES